MVLPRIFQYLLTILENHREQTPQRSVCATHYLGSLGAPSDSMFTYKTLTPSLCLQDSCD